MKVQDVILQFRRFIGDTEKTRYADDATPLEYFRQALDAAWTSRRHRPLFYVARIVNQKPAISRANDDLEIADEGKELLAHYMAYLSLSEDAEDAMNAALAEKHLLLFGK